jgi:SNF2 family DNA or RNA helicase
MIKIGLNARNKLIIEFPYSEELLEIVHQLPSRQFSKKTKLWEVPLIDLPIVRDVFEAYVRKHNMKIALTPEAKARYLELLHKYKQFTDIAIQNDLEYPTCLKPDVKMYPFQRVGAKFLEESKRGLLAMDMGLGKAESIESKLLTPDGWVRMGDIKVDDKVFGSDGKLHTVTGVFPQGLKDCYNIIFTDYSSVECCDEHLWNIQSPCQKLRKSGYKTKQLKEFRNDLHEKNGNTKWFIPMVKPINFIKKELPMDSYLIGALIGDGGLGTKNVVNFTTYDYFMASEISNLLPKDVILKRKRSDYEYSIISKNKGQKNIITAIIRDLELNVLSHKKHIPDIYKFSSIEQRLSLLQGLMDTDGGVDTKKDGVVITYTSKSEKLTDDVQFLVESLGGTAKKKSRITQYTYKGIKKNGRRSYRLNISLPEQIQPFRLPRKLILYTPRTKYQPYRGIKSVKYIGKKECQCISVDSPDHLYVTDHCILTHNTITAIAASARLMHQQKVKKPLIICPASLKFNWAIEIAKFSDYSYTIVGGEAKNRLQLYHNDSDFTIMNYDLLRLDIETIKNIEWDLIIADEIQRAKNYATAISKNIRRLQPEYIFGLTGTPIENDIMDLFTIMRFINPEILGNNGIYFKERYCEVDGYGKILDYKEDTAHEIDRKTSFFMMRRRKRDVLDDLPEKTTNFYYIHLNKEERKIYNEYKKNIASNPMDVLAQIVYLREICDCINLVTPQTKIISSKLEELKNILNDLPPDAKVVIFTEYARMAKIIEDHIPLQSVHLHGGVKNECRLEKEVEKKVRAENKDLKGKDLDLKIHGQKLTAVCKNCPYYNDDIACSSRKKIISKFNEEPNVRAMISTNAGKEGQNFQVASYVINFDMSFNPAVNEQRIARIDRIGQKSDHIFVINLVCVDTIEERILRILEEKQDLFNRVIDKTEKDTLKRLGIQELVSLL